MNRKTAPVIKGAKDYTLNLKPYAYAELNNGVPVYLVEAGTQDVLQIEWVFYAGNHYEKQKGVAAAANFLLKNGTGSRTAFQINEAFDYYGAFCNRACYNETAVVNLHCLSKHIDALLPVMIDLFTDARYPEEELAIYQQNAKQRLLVNLKKSEFVAGRLIDSYLYGADHPYGVYSSPVDIDQLSATPLRTYYNDYYVNGTCALFVAGKWEGDLLEKLNSSFGSLPWKKPSFQTPLIATHPATEKKYRIQNDPDSVQGAIRMARPFPNRHHPDFKKVMVLNNVFGGFFGSRLMSNIREDKGYTYGIYSYVQNHIQETAWLISTEAGKDVCEATIQEVYLEMQRLREEPVPEEEIDLVRNYMIGSILGDLDGPFHIMAKWKNIILNNLTESYFYESVDAIKNITATDLQGLANQYLQPDSFYELVVY
ncbi:MAG TPA: pitrilysin family protein [Ferruginibacter sp.]|nr:pitrilysin family protein [Ferruginibacter sp.]